MWPFRKKKIKTEVTDVSVCGNADCGILRTADAMKRIRVDVHGDKVEMFLCGECFKRLRNGAPMRYWGTEG